MSKLWVQCNGAKQFCLLSKKVWRLDRIKFSAIQKLVDSEEEQSLLEGILRTKTNSSKNFSPPPLEYPSRFGSRNESSLWYGSLEIETAFAEKAFYGFYFLTTSSGNYDRKALFKSVFYKLETSKGIDLTKDPFLNYRNIISSPIEYQECQLLGATMRNQGVEVFCYYSARAIEDGINVGVFTPKVFKRNYQDQFEIWQSTMTKDRIDFVLLSRKDEQHLHFPVKQFLVDDKLPRPAN